MSGPSWVAIHHMAHGFIKLRKHLHHNKAVIHKGHELGQILGDGEGQGGLVCYSSMGPQRVGHDWETEQNQDMSLLCELRGPTSTCYLNSKEHQILVSNTILQ